MLAFCVGDRENEQAWKDLLDDLKGRGVKTIDLWVSDGNQAMLGSISKKFPDSARQRCVVHKMDNVLSYVLTKQQEQLKPELKALFIRRIGKPLIRSWPLLSKSTAQSTRQPSSAYGVIWKRV